MSSCVRHAGSGVLLASLALGPGLSIGAAPPGARAPKRQPLLADTLRRGDVSFPVHRALEELAFEKELTGWAPGLLFVAAKAANEHMIFQTRRTHLALPRAEAAAVALRLRPADLAEGE